MEIKILILKDIPDLATLKYIMLSSRTFFPAYLLARREIFCCILQKQYGPLLREVVAAVRSRGLYLGTYKEEAIALLDTWRRSEEIRALAPKSSSRIDKPRDMKEISDLIRFNKVLQFFLNDYATSALPPAWIDPNKWENSMLPVQLSSSEKHRFIRAFCRLQIHGNILGRPEYDLSSRTPQVWDLWSLKKAPPFFSARVEAYRLFFAAIPPWEYDEMGCVWTYVKTKIDNSSIYKDVSEGLHDLVNMHRHVNIESPEYWENLPQAVRPPGWINLDSLMSLKYITLVTGSLVAQGPEFVYRLLHAEPLLQRNMVITNGDYGSDTFIGKPSRMTVSEDDMLPLIYPADQHAIQGYEQFWSTLSRVEQPSLAWRKIHMKPETPADNFEYAVDLEEHEVGWEWGCAIWDDERVKEWDAPLLEEDWDVV